MDISIAHDDVAGFTGSNPVIHWEIVTNACFSARGTSERLKSLAVMRPQSQNQNLLPGGENLVNDSMLKVDPAGETSGQVSAQGLVFWRYSEGICRDHDFMHELTNRVRPMIVPILRRVPA